MLNAGTLIICKAGEIHARIHGSSYFRTKGVIFFIQLPITEKSVKAVRLYRFFFVACPLGLSILVVRRKLRIVLNFREG